MEEIKMQMRLQIPAGKLEAIASSGIQIKVSPAEIARAVEYRRRIANSKNPVEFVNDMYGCHPGSNGQGYFEAVFAA